MTLGTHIRLTLACSLLLLALSTWGAGQVHGLTLLLSEPGGVYQEAAERLRDDLLVSGEPGFQVRIQNQAERSGPGGEALLVAFGVKALRTALTSRSNAPILALMVPRQSYEALAGEHAAARGRMVTAIWLDQPYGRQLALLRAALPQVKRVGVLAGEASKSQTDEIVRAGESLQLRVSPRLVGASGEVFTALADFEREVDALLLIPDPLVVNRATLQSLMLNTYHQRLPVLAYSESLLRSGALLALYATPRQVGQEGAVAIRAIFQRGEPRLPPPAYTRALTVKLNWSVARSLGFNPPSEAELTARLETAP